MKNIRAVFAPAVLALTLLLGIAAVPAFAAAAKTTKVPPPPDMSKTIKSVDLKGSAVVILYTHSKLTHTYRVDDMTALKVNGVPGKLADIKSGMVVTDYAERDNDDLDSLTLTGYGQEPAAAKPAAKAKPKPKPAPSST